MLRRGGHPLNRRSEELQLILSKQNQRYWDELNNAVNQVHVYWLIYRQLFDEQKNRLFLRGLAETCFGPIEDSLYRDVLLRLCVLAENAESRVKKTTVQNFSLENFFLKMKPNLVEASRVEKKISAYKKVVTPLRTKRNKLIAHNDRNRLLGKPQSFPSRRKIEDCLRKLRGAMSLLAKSMKKEIRNFQLDSISGDGVALLRKLRGG